MNLIRKISLLGLGFFLHNEQAFSLTFCINRDDEAKLVQYGIIAQEDAPANSPECQYTTSSKDVGSMRIVTLDDGQLLKKEKTCNYRGFSGSTYCIAPQQGKVISILFPCNKEKSVSFCALTPLTLESSSDSEARSTIGSTDARSSVKTKSSSTASSEERAQWDSDARAKHKTRSDELRQRIEAAVDRYYTCRHIEKLNEAQCSTERKALNDPILNPNKIRTAKDETLYPDVTDALELFAMIQRRINELVNNSIEPVGQCVERAKCSGLSRIDCINKCKGESLFTPEELSTAKTYVQQAVKDEVGRSLEKIK